MPVIANVPRNNALAATSVDVKGAETVWARYLKEWTRWNHFRTLTALTAAALLGVATRLG